MPLNTLRLNHQASSHPNERIVFIKPLPRSASEKHHYDTADTFLRAIAAQCLPIMKSHFLSVTTLEEYEPNREFIGRNFNNGEVIQLVLRSKSGAWLPFNMVQMVMMHELAHNDHMNHGKEFWETRNRYSAELRSLWAKGYTGEGFWGGGRCLRDLGQVTGNNAMIAGELRDVEVCGGTFRSRRRKRKRKAGDRTGEDGRELTWKEKTDRRIEKKFGKNGQSLGEDEDRRLLLEISSKGNVGSKPRVAQSKRGRELRAAAALARFETSKEDGQESQMSKPDDDTSDDEYDEEVSKGDEAKDVDGQRLLDSLGFGMVKVCDGEERDDLQVKNEAAELEGLESSADLYHPRSREEDNIGTVTSLYHDVPLESQDIEHQAAARKRKALYDIPQYRGSPTPPLSPNFKPETTQPKRPVITIRRLGSSQPNHSLPLHSDPPESNAGDVLQGVDSNVQTVAPEVLLNDAATVECPICSLLNARLNPTCQACAHVLDRRKDPRHWRCGSQVCRESQYTNAGDAGVCGVCGLKRSG